MAELGEATSGEGGSWEAAGEKPRGKGKTHLVEQPVSRLPDRIYYIDCQENFSQTEKARDTRSERGATI